MISELLEGAYDLHVHTAPDVVERKFDDIELAKRFEKKGLKGFVIKSHYFVTSGRARLINKINNNINAVGAITLNNSVGGVNPLTVELAARDGAKMVWMPTFDSQNEQEFFLQKNKYDNLPYWAKLQLDLKNKGIINEKESIYILNEQGDLTENCIETLNIIKSNDLILATGHLGKEEIFSLVKKSKEKNLKKVIVTHPTFPSVNLTLEEQKNLVEMGAFMEYNYSLIKPKFGLTWEEFYHNIKVLGPENCILSTDTGQPYNPYADEGLEIMVTKLFENGFSKSQIKQMTKENTVFLIEG